MRFDPAIPSKLPRFVMMGAPTAAPVAATDVIATGPKNKLKRLGSQAKGAAFKLAKKKGGGGGCSG